MASEQDRQIILPIIDSHIHLYPKSELASHKWYEPGTPLAKQHSVEDYRAATETSPSLLGFIYVETDRKNDESAGAAGWAGAVQEMEWCRRLVLGEPKAGEGHAAEDSRLCLGLVLWAPVASGPAAVEEYLSKGREVMGDAWAKVKGFRYLLQDKPHGTMLEKDFVDAVKLLGQKGYVFEIGVDQHRRGKKQLDETISFIEQVHDGVPEEQQTTFVINHLCKPDLTIYNLGSDPSFHAWRTAMYTLGKASRTYMKLSGAFSEMPESLKNESPNTVFESLFGWLGIVLATFGASRLMFGSDWPVCTVGTADAWTRWRDVVQRMCWMATLEDEDRAMIFGGTAKKAYGL